MNILITGTTGFLGSNVTHMLIKNGYEIFGVIRKNSDLRRVQDVYNKNKFHPVDLTEIEDVFKKNDINIIIHTATSYGRQGEAVADIEEVNINFPLHLLALGIKYGTKGFINSDTFLHLENKEQKNYKYIKTKKDFIIKAEKMAVDKIKFINMKIEQMYGPDDNPTKFIPLLIKEFLSEKNPIQLNPGLQKRDYIYIDDVVEAYKKVIETIDDLENFEKFNIGSGKTNTLRETVEEIKLATESKSIPNFGAIPYHKQELMISVANVKNNKKINWKTKISLKSGIGKTVEFYKDLN